MDLGPKENKRPKKTQDSEPCISYLSFTSMKLAVKVAIGISKIHLITDVMLLQETRTERAL